MSDRRGWEEANARYLSTALAWLRLRLERAAGDAQAGDGTVEAAAAEMAAAATADPPPAAVVMAERLGLSRFEQEVLLLCAAMELDTRTARLCAQAQGDPARPYPTFALALTVFDEPAWAALAPGGPLRHWRLIEIAQAAAEPLTTSPLRADERIVSYLKGLNYLDDRLLPLLAPAPRRADATDLPPSQLAVVAELAERIARADQVPAVQLLGPDAASKRLVAQQTAAILGLALHRMPGALLAAHAADLDVLARLWDRESLLLPVALHLELGDGPDEPATERHLAAARFLARTASVVFVDTAGQWPDAGRPVIPVEVARPTPAEQRAVWAAALGPDGEPVAVRLAGQFDLNLPDIRRIARDVADAGGDCAGRSERLWDACRRATAPRPGGLAQRVAATATWDRIVLPDDELDLLHRLSSQVAQRGRVYDDWGFRQVMSRGFGITALFAGPSGTGKTMAAEVIANHLRLDLYRIDLSAVVSKYIGETEKHLRRLFDEFEAGGAILFLDEADALLGKRTEVRDSHDRYANIEVNYLLQRMEAYRGLAILATNAKGALDSAFLRRIRFIVDFPFPDAALRRRIWAGALPAATPRDPGLDLGRLASLNLTGGSIHNIALNAAFRAADAGSPVTMPALLGAARTEFRKLQLPFREQDLRSSPSAREEVPA
jgi:ATPase family associated with various cellular activities (AAA)/Winged helix domain, variant